MEFDTVRSRDVRFVAAKIISFTLSPDPAPPMGSIVTAAVTIDRMAGATQLVSIEIDAGVVVSDSVAILSGVTSGVRDIRFPPVVLPGTYPAKAVLGASVATTQFTVA